MECQALRNVFLLWSQSSLLSAPGEETLMGRKGLWFLKSLSLKVLHLRGGCWLEYH